MIETDSEKIVTDEDRKLEFGSHKKLVASLTQGFRDQCIELSDIEIENILEKLFSGPKKLEPAELVTILNLKEPEKIARVLAAARSQRELLFGNEVFIRAVIDMSNYCRRNCTFCGNAAKNRDLPRYRADADAAFKKAAEAKTMGVDLIHLAAGEDMGLKADVLAGLVRRIHEELGCTVELALGVRPIKDYEALFKVGARRAIIKFETTNEDIFTQIKPRESFKERMILLLKLRSMGYRIGTGNIIGLPGQSTADVARDLSATLSLNPDMASTSVFTPNQEAALHNEEKGDETMGLLYIALLRILMKECRVSIPTNSTLGKEGKYKALEIGAMELSLNMTPQSDDGQYSLYDGKDRVKAKFCDLEDNAQKSGFQIKPFSQIQF